MIRLALVGCGGISKAHADRFAKNSSRVKVLATVDPDLAKAQEAAEAVGAEKFVADFHDILPEVDALLLAVPHYLHHSIALDCINAGKHVLLEKPMCITEQQCLDLIEAQKKLGTVLMIGYCMRYHPIAIRLKELIDDKTYGDTFHISMWTEQLSQWEDGSYHHRADGIGGGQFFSHGCHYVDLLLWYLGNPMEGMHIGTNYGTPWMEKEGTSDAVIKFENGAVGYHFGTWGARGTRHLYAFHVHTTEGMLEADFGTAQLIFHKGQERTVILQDEEDTTKHMDREMAHFLDCIEQNKTPITNGPTAIQSLRVIWKLYEAEEKGTIANLRGLSLP